MSDFNVTKNHNECLNKRGIRSLYAVNFFFSMAVAVTTYFETPFLSHYFSDQYIGYIFSVSNLVALLVIFFYSKIINALGKFFMSTLGLLFYASSLFLLVWAENMYIIIGAFVLMLLSYQMTFINLDIMLEDCSADNVTGRVRGLYYTMISIAWLIMPVFGGFLLANDFSTLFLFGGIIGMFSTVLFLFFFKGDGRRVEYEDGIIHTIKQVWANPPVNRAFYLSFVLRSFFAITSIYVPLHMASLGFGLDQIGIAFSIMLIPYLAEYYFGRLLDKYNIEKPILGIGAMVMASAVAVMFWLDGSSLLHWALVLFTSRIGCMLFEISMEVYFYKQIDREDVNLINFYRNSGPLASMIMPLLGGLVLGAFGLHAIYPLSAVFVLTSFWAILTLPKIQENK